jgi:predicted TIM-barrel fold metal-dependent hydrolase
VSRYIDLECDLVPIDAAAASRAATVIPGGDGPERVAGDPDYGFGNYGVIFRAREAPPRLASVEQVVEEMDRAGVEKGVVSAADNALARELLRAHPGRFICLAYLNPYDGMRGVREFERLVREDGFAGLAVASLLTNLPASDRRYYPLYAKCVELDVPVRIYTAMTYANDRPYELGHPRHLDQIGIDFPELRMIAGLAGWPWVNELVGVLRRHPNLYVDTAAHRPRYFSQAGSGWEMFMQFANTLLQDKVMVAFSSRLLGASYPDLITEYEALPLKETVKRKWLYDNAARFLRL